MVALTPDELLTTTRSVRKRLDLTRPVPLDLVRECIGIAVQAPTSSNRQHWNFVVVADPDQRRTIAEICTRQWNWIVGSPYSVTSWFSDNPVRSAEQLKVSDSAAYLAEHIAEVPVLVLPCIEVEGDGQLNAMNQAGIWGSIMPAAWSYMLAAHTRGLGVAWTALTTMVNDEIRAVVGYPDNVLHAALMPTAYYTGDSFKPVPRIPLDDIIHVDTW